MCNFGSQFSWNVILLMKEVIYSDRTIDFAKIALEYCAFIQKSNELRKNEFIDQMSKILPLLYLKIQLIPSMDNYFDSDMEIGVTENAYASITERLSKLLEEDDVYLETFHPDIQYSDTPIATTISENLADIYQDLGNFIAVFKLGNEESMNDALFLCIQNFKSYWGQKLVNVLRAIHNLKYREDN